MAAQLQYIKNFHPSYPGIPVISLSGDIDESNQSTLEELMNTFLEDPQVQFLVIELEHLEYINSGVIGLFAVLHGKFAEAGKEFLFANANEHIFDIIDLVGLTSIITLYPSTDEALASISFNTDSNLTPKASTPVQAPKTPPTDAQANTSPVPPSQTPTKPSSSFGGLFSLFK